MVYRNMYIGYTDKKELTYREDPDIVTASAAFDGDTAYLYFESLAEDTVPEDIVIGDMKPFPSGEKWVRMPQIFHYFPSEDDAYCRHIKDKTPIFAVNHLEYGMVANYIYMHRDLELSNPCNFNRFYSIYIYGNTIVSYQETPSETITWAELEGKEHRHPPKNWHALMDTHFKAWPDGKKAWISLEGVRKLRAND